MRLGEAQILNRLQSIGAEYAPLVIVSIQREFPVSNSARADALMRLRVVNGPSFDALAEITSPASPKNVRMKSLQLLDLIKKAGNKRLIPLLIAPYISPRQADTLKEAGLSWLDLSGNMVIRVRDQIYIERTGRPNRFPDTTPIKRVFQGTASLVARALLLEPGGFDSLSGLADFINKRGASIAVSTTSKVINSLEQDLLVSKEDSRIRVINAPKLLTRLGEGYASASRGQKPAVRRFAIADAARTLESLCSVLDDTYIFCGFYAAQLKGLAASTQITLYSRDFSRVKQASENSLSDLLPDEEFGQLSIIEMKSQIPWFNTQTVNGLRVVDDVELYLEMTIDTPRGPKVADVLQSRILQGFPRG